MKRIMILLAAIVCLAACEQKDGGWKPVISVDPNDTAKPRTAIINMTAGDVFTQISVAQN